MLSVNYKSIYVIRWRIEVNINQKIPKNAWEIPQRSFIGLYWKEI